MASQKAGYENDCEQSSAAIMEVTDILVKNSPTP